MDVEQEYQKALDYLYSFIDYSLTRSLKYSPEKFSLSRIIKFMDLLGNPQNSYPVIHVAGTKGKGSVCSFCVSALQQAGYKTGFYSSPHLDEYTERIQINGEQISRRDFVDLVEEIKPVVEKVPQITTFELTTALCYLYFAIKKIDIAVLEVGLGGRLDPTNIITPLVSVITSLSYDHMAILGNTLTEIATEKAGIIKPGRPVVSAPQKEEARVVIERIAQERNAPLIQVGKDYQFTPLAHSFDGQSFSISAKSQHADSTALDTLGTFEIPLLGLHQIENATTAYAALQTVQQFGLTISEEDIHKGFKKVYWPARFELLRREPPVIVDSAHNRYSAQMLKQALDDYLPGRPVILVFGASEDKDIQGMFSELLPRVECMITTQSIHPRATEAEHLADMAKEFNRPVYSMPKIEDAFSLGLSLAGQNKALLVTGSVFIAAAARDIWFSGLHK